MHLRGTTLPPGSEYALHEIVHHVTLRLRGKLNEDEIGNALDYMPRHKRRNNEAVTIAVTCVILSQLEPGFEPPQYTACLLDQISDWGLFPRIMRWVEAPHTVRNFVAPVLRKVRWEAKRARAARAEEA